MARGKSGRIVLEIDPELKRQLYLTLEKDQKTMKEWFVREASDLIQYGSQNSLFTSDTSNDSDLDAGKE